MKNRKFIMYTSIIVLILFIVGIGILVVNNHRKNKNNIIEEYTPEQEISDEQLRKTNIILYFCDASTGELATEIRQIDSKSLLENPERKLIEFLIDGPQDSNLSKLIPESTKLINAELKKGILNIDFSEEFINGQNLGIEKETKIINSILNTVTQLNEIKGIKILINGEEGKKFPDAELNFEEVFLFN